MCAEPGMINTHHVERLIMTRRSVLFSPGDQARKLEGALQSDADVIVFDLEDGVAPPDKQAAREVIIDVLDGVTASTEAEVLIRLNPVTGGGADDIGALATGGIADVIDGFVLPKVMSPADVHHARGLLRDAGLPRSIWCLIESPGGLNEAESIAASDRVAALIFGGEDYAASVGAERTDAGLELLYPRQRVVAAAASADIDAIDGISAELDDMSRVLAEATESRSFGFDGKLAIHPAQIDPIHEAFTPSGEQLDWAERVLEAAAEAESGVFRVDGQMIDEPLIERARQLVERARR